MTFFSPAGSTLIMVRALVNVSERKREAGVDVGLGGGGGGDSGLGEEQVDLGEQQPPPPQPEPTSQVLHTNADGIEADVAPGIEVLIPDFSSLAVTTLTTQERNIDSTKPKTSATELDGRFKHGAQKRISTYEPVVQNFSLENLAQQSLPPEEYEPHQLSALLMALAKHSLKLLDCVKMSNMMLSQLGEDVSQLEVSANIPGDDEMNWHLGKSVASPSVQLSVGVSYKYTSLTNF